MNYPTRLNPNILLTERCNQSCNYCFAKQQMNIVTKKEMPLNDILRLADFLKKNKQNKIRLMGGEPTLHSQFKPIISHILSRNLKIKVFTNGLFSQELAHWLSEKGGSIQYIINLTVSGFQSEYGKRIIENNLKTLKNSEIVAAITINSLDFEDEPIIDFIKKNKIESVRCGIANDLIGDSNWLDFEHYKKFGSIIAFLTDKLREAGVSKIILNCGFTPCMFQASQINDLLKSGVEILGWGCKGKKGVFDVSTDLSIFPCFVLTNFKAKNIFDFKDLKMAKKFLENLIFFSADELFRFEPCEDCLYFKRFECRGPCRGWVINNLNRQKTFANFPKPLYYKIIYNLLYFSRNWL